MYKDLYQMESEPFINKPLIEVFFNSFTHDKGWNYLLEGISSKEQFLIITGGHGRGKTLLYLKLLDFLNNSHKNRYVYFPSPNIGFKEILLETAKLLDINADLRESSEIQSRIFNFLKKKNETDNYYIIFDDAHELDDETLKQITFLSNTRYDNFTPFCIIFFAHPVFFEKLNKPDLEPLSQRLQKRYCLSGFDFKEVKEYVYFRLYKSGAPGVPKFREEAFTYLFLLTKGVPRLINNVCYECLKTASSLNLLEIDIQIVKQAINTLSFQIKEISPDEKVNKSDNSDNIDNIDKSIKKDQKKVRYKVVFISVFVIITLLYFLLNRLNLIGYYSETSINDKNKSGAVKGEDDLPVVTINVDTKFQKF